jgi:hypothetical protein
VGQQSVPQREVDESGQQMPSKQRPYGQQSAEVVPPQVPWPSGQVGGGGGGIVRLVPDVRASESLRTIAPLAAVPPMPSNPFRIVRREAPLPSSRVKRSNVELSMEAPFGDSSGRSSGKIQAKVDTRLCEYSIDILLPEQVILAS